MPTAIASSPIHPSRDQLQREIRRRARTDLRWWCKLCDWGYQSSPHIVRLIEKLEAVERGDIRRLMVAMPPRHGKTVTTSWRFPAWFLGRRPDSRVILTSYGESLPLSASRQVRNRLAEHGRDVFGVEVAGDKSAVQSWDVAGRAGGLVAAGIGGPITGQGADLAVIDDPIKSIAEAFSKTYRDRVWAWYQNDLFTRLSPAGRIVLVFTRWHQDDLAGRLDADEKSGGEKWERLILPMEDESGALLWPDRYSPEFVAQLKRDPYRWEALYQQRPVSPEGEIFRREWWRYFDLAPAKMAESCRELTQSWDFTFKRTDGSDFVVGQVWGKKKGQFFLLDQVRDRMDYPAARAAIIQLSRKWPEARRKLIEDAANGPAIIAELSGSISGIEAVTPAEFGNKEARARSVTPLLSAGNVFLPRDAPWVLDFVEECRAFPRGAHDDQVDAMSQALLKMGGDSDAEFFLGMGAP